MGTMAATLAHEVNQPLTAICNYGQAATVLLEASENLDRESLREAVSEMAQQALRASTIVRRLREFVVRGEVSKTVEDVPNLINEASALALVGTRQKGIECHFDFDVRATPVLADRIQVEQVLVNLMRNAVEAMANSEKRQLSIKTKLVDPETVEVSVKDTGPGIAPELADHLFQPFSSTKQSGMGLGLSICRTIIEAHGGRIFAHPVPGGGTEFAFTLPRGVAPKAEAVVTCGELIGS
jgi:two-component system sensor kinase FixL